MCVWVNIYAFICIIFYFAFFDVVFADIQRVAEEGAAAVPSLLPGPGAHRHGHEPGRHRRLRQIRYELYVWLHDSPKAA